MDDRVALKRTICIIALDQSALPNTLRGVQARFTGDPHEAAVWLLGHTATDSSPAATADSVLRALSETPETTSAKEAARSLTGFLSQNASNVQGHVIQAAGPVHVHLGEQRPSPTPDANPVGFRSNIRARGRLPFVGRQELIDEMDHLMADVHRECVVVLHGEPGAGKSELAREFGRLRRGRYAGGTFVMDASTSGFALEFASLGEKVLGFTFPPEMKLDDRGERTFLSLGRDPVLVIYDNVVSFERVQPWLPYSGMPCHVVITTLLDRPTRRWPCLEVKPLTPEQSAELVRKVTDGKLDAASTRTVVTHAGGLPVQILPHAAALADDRGRRRNRPSPARIEAEAASSFRAAYDRLERSGRVLLHAAAFFNVQHIPSGEITRYLGEGLHWTEDQVERAFDNCFDLHVLQGSPDEPRMHQLFASFIRETALAREDQDSLNQVTAVQAVRFVELAEQVSANPADLTTARLLLDYPLTPDIWEAMGKTFTLEMEGAGRALRGIGRFEEARPWSERAVEEAEKGDAHGRIDHESLGSSVHQVGWCYSSTGRFEEARPWFERAMAEKEKGDVHGRIDHANLGRSLHHVGYCYSSTGRFEEARPWFERAVAEKQKGNVHGRIDHESLGISLHQVGYCYSSTGRWEDARTWFERAAAEKEKGSVHGRVDHESLGISLHQVGGCYSSMERWEQARPWFERAVAEAEKATCTGASTTQVWEGACIKWAGAIAARSGLRKRGRGMSAPSRRPKKATCTGASTIQVWESA